MYSIIQPTVNKGYMQFTLKHIYSIFIVWCIFAAHCYVHVIMKMKLLGRQYSYSYSCVSLDSL